MLSTKDIITIEDVPVEWGFKYYLNLKEDLHGQDVMIRSPFNSKDSVPSCNIYWNKKLNRYQFKDYSSGEGGSYQDLVKLMFNLSTRDAFNKIVEDYKKFIKENGKYHIEEFKEYSKYKVKDYHYREWNSFDKNYWYTKYRIGSKILDTYNVRCLESYTLHKEQDGETHTITISGNHIYGYFRTNNELYKIYQPKNKDKKFLKLKDYIQGTDQLKYNQDTLIITSSLKDLMCLMNFKFPVESVAPHSENTLIPEHMIMAYRHKYKNILVMLDNDEAGLRAMNKYKEKYNLDFIHLKGAKDLSDNVEKIGKEQVELVLKHLIETKLKENE